ncbi:MAG: hypothetical protein AAF401_06445 [Pseudomonadota bacterium]
MIPMILSAKKAASTAMVAALLTSVWTTPVLAAGGEDVLTSPDQFGVAQVLRRNTGPDVTTVRPDEEVAPTPEEVPAEEAEDNRRQLLENGDSQSGWKRVDEPTKLKPKEETATAPAVSAPAATAPVDPIQQVRPGGFLLRDRETLTGEPRFQRRLANPERRRPESGPFVPEPAPFIDPTAVDAPPPRAAGPDDFLAVPDRWRLVDTLGIIEENPLDPYNQNTLKGDKPIYKGHCFPFLEGLIGKSKSDCFLILLGISDTVLEPRSFPTPVGVQTTERPGTDDLFGQPNQWVFNQNLIHGFSLVNGDTAFRPQDIEFRYTGVMNVNYADLEERRVLRADTASGSNRFDRHYGVLELFVDYHIANITDRYDFYSTRVGIQPFSSDFRGFLFQDSQLGARFFGNWDNNLWQYNLAWFRRLEKDTNSGLNDVLKTPREDDVFIANVYRQDFPILGLVSQGTLVYNRNREGDDRFFDDNGFIARPASIGTQRGRDYDVFYLGYNVDGRIGRVNLTGSAYYAFGEDDNVFTDEESRISAYFAAAEVSIDDDWRRYRLSALYASGDDDPLDDVQEGFDAIFENPQFAGGDTSYWIRQQIPLIGGGGPGLSMRNGVLASLRHSKEHGQSNFVNPGILLLGAGADFDLTPEFRLSFNANYMWFNDTSTLEVLRVQGDIDKEIGLDLSVAAIWRPFQHQNVVFRLSGAALIPGAGFNSIDDSHGMSCITACASPSHFSAQHEVVCFQSKFNNSYSFQCAVDGIMTCVESFKDL